MITLFFLFFNLVLSFDSLLKEEEIESKEEPGAFDISIFSDTIQYPLRRCDEEGSYLPTEWQPFFHRGKIDMGWCYFSYTNERYEEDFVDKTTFQCIKFHIGYPIIRDEKDIEFDQYTLENVRLSEMQNPLNAEYYLKNKDLEQRWESSANPKLFETELQELKKIIFGMENYQVAEYIYAKRIIAKILPFVITNGFELKIAQNFVYTTSANKIPERRGKMIVIYTSSTERAKELIPGLIKLFEELDLNRFEFYHPPEGEIFKGLYTRYGICSSQFPGNFGARGANGRTICRNAKDQIIRCRDGRPFIYQTDDGNTRYLTFSDYNTVQFKDSKRRIGANEISYQAKIPGDADIYNFKDTFWIFLKKIGAVGKYQRVEQSQWVKDFYEDAGIIVNSWPDGPGKRLAHGPDLEFIKAT